ncbi:unnamed protein product [Pleuronectes platessa]|uniref:Uncharacterized protein n=1 Tax=Pleuronectes platessa TaxID=8262 RepID=A0A9N7YGN3_PLEPL|nr:unnamed protein product [Pleuronectes platessa]
MDSLKAPFSARGDAPDRRDGTYVGWTRRGLPHSCVSPYPRAPPSLRYRTEWFTTSTPISQHAGPQGPGLPEYHPSGAPDKKKPPPALLPPRNDSTFFYSSREYRTPAVTPDEKHNIDNEICKLHAERLGAEGRATASL